MYNTIYYTTQEKLNIFSSKLFERIHKILKSQIKATSFKLSHFLLSMLIFMIHYVYMHSKVSSFNSNSKIKFFFEIKPPSILPTTAMHIILLSSFSHFVCRF